MTSWLIAIMRDDLDASDTYQQHFETKWAHLHQWIIELPVNHLETLLHFVEELPYQEPQPVVSSSSVAI
jgi:hypothetical protein